MDERIVVFGGTFDPVHNGHLIVARAMAEARGLERVTLMPAAVPPHKGGARASGAHRLEMLRLATAGEALFDVCDLELTRTGPSYTIQTVRDLLEAGWRRVTWMIGADMLHDLPTWRDAQELIELVDLLVAVRQPWTARMEEIILGLERYFAPGHVERLRGCLVPTPMIEISSTEIRRRVGDHSSIRYLVDESVRSYIVRNGLYI